METDPKPSQPAPLAEQPATDPDAIGLPPGAVLPDAATYKRDQLWSWVVSNAVGLAILLVIWLLGGARKNFLLFLILLLGLSLLANLLRWASMASEVRRRSRHSR